MTLRDGMWAVLFTDLVGSTAQRARLGDAAGDSLRREHDALLGAVLATHRGEVVSDTGDGAMCVFASSADAIGAGIALQQAVDRRNRAADEPLGLRVGVSAGELVVEGDGLMGLAAHEAARVCALCESGEVLISDLVRLMAGSRTDATLTERGAFELKGIPQPIVVWEATWTPSDEPALLPVPNRLCDRGAWPFSGRSEDLARLVDISAAAFAGSPCAVLLSGEPGIGKTRLAAEVASAAHDAGAVVLYGQCDADVGTPFLPFAEALGWYLEHAGEVHLGDHPGDLARLTDRVRARVPDAPEPLSADADTVVHRLLDAVTSWLHDLARDRPVVLVIDDLHWATKTTLLVFRHLLRNATDERILIIGTYRDTDLDRKHPLGAMLGDLRRIPGVERVDLTGLDESGVLEFLESAAAGSSDVRIAELAAALRAETEGNPFFLGEVVRHLVETGAIRQVDGRWTSDLSVEDLGLPQGVREVIGQRLDRLSAETNRLLTVAALVGREFDVRLVAQVEGLLDDDALDLLDPAVAARLVEEIGTDRFRFSHALVRATLADEPGTSKRLRLHARVAAALETIAPDDAAALAHHWMEAADSGDPDRAISYAIAAGAATERSGAYEDAVELYRRALDLCDGGGLDDRRRELLVRLATVLQLMGAPEAAETLREAVDAARAADDGPNLVAAAILLGLSTDWGVGKAPAELMTEALLRTADTTPTQRAALLIGIANHLQFDEEDRRLAMADEALAIAREVGDPALLASVGGTYLHAASRPDNLDARIALAHELDAIAPRLDNPVTRWAAVPVQPAWESGDLEWVTRNDAEGERVLENIPYLYGSIINLAHRAKRALFSGRVQDADEYAASMAASLVDQNGMVAYAATIASVRIAQGRSAELLEAVELAAAEQGSVGATTLYRATLAFLRFTSGDDEAAHAILRAAAADRFREQGNDSGWYAYFATYAELAVGLWDVDAAAMLHPILLPYCDRIANFPLFTFGSVARHVGRLETVLGRYGEADEHLAFAQRRHEDWGARLFLAQTLGDRAELLLVRDGRAATGPGLELIDRARAVAAECGAPGIDRYLDRIMERADTRGLA